MKLKIYTLLVIATLLQLAFQVKLELYSNNLEADQSDYKPETFDNLIEKQKNVNNVQQQELSLTESLSQILDQDLLPSPPSLQQQIETVEQRIEHNVFRLVHSIKQEQKLKESVGFHQLTYGLAVAMFVLAALVAIMLAFVAANLLLGATKQFYYNRQLANSHFTV